MKDNVIDMLSYSRLLSILNTTTTKKKANQNLQRERKEKGEVMSE